MEISEFKVLEKELDKLILKLDYLELLEPNKTKSLEFLNVFNQSPYLLTLHDVERYKPILINDKMKEFYGFNYNYLKGLNYLYYFNTIHISMYPSLIKSVSFFRKKNNTNLNLNYKLLFKGKEWKSVIGTSKTIINTNNKNPKYAITLAKENSHIKTLDWETRYAELTNREKEIVQLLRRNIGRKKVASLLNISENTIHTHLKKIFKKLNINKASDIIILNEEYLIPNLIDKPKFQELTKREKQIIELLGIGLSKKEISSCLNISELTVQTHSKNIFKKLNISNVSDIMAFKKTPE